MYCAVRLLCVMLCTAQFVCCVSCCVLRSSFTVCDAVHCAIRLLCVMLCTAQFVCCVSCCVLRSSFTVCDAVHYAIRLLCPPRITFCISTIDLLFPVHHVCNAELCRDTNRRLVSEFPGIPLLCFSLGSRHCLRLQVWIAG